MLPQEHPDLAEVRGGAELLQEAQVFFESLQQHPRKPSSSNHCHVCVTQGDLPFSTPHFPLGLADAAQGALSWALWGDTRL